MLDEQGRWYRCMNCRLCGLDAGEAEFCCSGMRERPCHPDRERRGGGGAGFSRHRASFAQSLRLGLISNRSADGGCRVQRRAETREAVFQLSGMWCTSCGWLIEHALSRLRGVRSAERSIYQRFAEGRGTLRSISPEGRIAERVGALGYRVAGVSRPARALRRRTEGPAAAHRHRGVSFHERDVRSAWWSTPATSRRSLAATGATSPSC